MNRYLEKIAATLKYELEPGVFYDRKKHDVVLSKDKASSVAQRARAINTMASAASWAFPGAFLGAGVYEATHRRLGGKVLPIVAGVGTTAAMSALGGALGYNNDQLAAIRAKKGYLEDMEHKHWNRIEEIESSKYE